jgi:protein NRD1
MHFVMAGSMAVAGIANGGLNEAQGGQWQQGNWEEHGSRHNGGRRGGRGRGNYAGGRGGHGNYRDGGGTEQSEPSCAIVLNGDVEPDDESMAQDPSDEPSELHDSTGGSGGGQMQRVGDKWMFVRAVEA